jgi:hypothetical protein
MVAGSSVQRARRPSPTTSPTQEGSAREWSTSRSAAVFTARPTPFSPSSDPSGPPSTGKRPPAGTPARVPHPAVAIRPSRRGLPWTAPALAACSTSSGRNRRTRWRRTAARTDLELFTTSGSRPCSSTPPPLATPQRKCTGSRSEDDLPAPQGIPVRNVNDQDRDGVKSRRDVPIPVRRAGRDRISMSASTGLQTHAAMCMTVHR